MSTATATKTKIKGAVLIFSCQKHTNTRLKDLILPNTTRGWPVFVIIGNPFLTCDYETMDTTTPNIQTLYIKCEDSYIHVLKKVTMTIQIILSLYEIEEGILRCGDDLIFNQENLRGFLQYPGKRDYMGVIALKIQGIYRHYNSFMVDYYKNHQDDLKNPVHGLTEMTMNDLAKFTEMPLCSYTGGVVTYLSKKSCKILVSHMMSIDWNVFHHDKEYGYPYVIEDIGIGYILSKNNIEPYACDLYTNDPSKFSQAVALHTNNYK
jgi:hypothetical protein